MENNEIVIENLSKSFGEKVVLSGFSARFVQGEKSSIMAASGKGKTTLLRIMLGLEVADSGTIRGMENRKISCVFQEDRLCENLSPFVNISIVSSANKESIQDALKKIGLAEEMNAPVYTLSGGMKRRVAILRALLFDADIVLLDEPFKGLDTETKKNVIELVGQYTEGKTLILVTHIEEEAQALGTTHNIELG